VSPGSLSSIPVGGSETFTVAPVINLGAGTYTAVISVSGSENSITASFNVSFTVNPQSTEDTYNISLSQTGPHTFPALDAGYGPQEGITVTVTNTGTQPTGALNITTTSSHFRVSPASLSSIPVGGSNTFTAAPVTNLSAGTYTAAITVSGGNDITASFDVSFTVNTPQTPDDPYGISLNQTESHTFPSVNVGYAAQEGIIVTVTNTGTRPTGTLNIRTTSNRFRVSPASLSSIAKDGSATFTVTPAASLGVNTYTATITVSGGNDITASFDVSFTVNPLPGTLSITVGFNLGAIAITGSDGINIISRTGAPSSITLSAVGYNDVVWYVDGAASGISGNTITISALNYTLQPHSVTFTGYKNGVPFSQAIPFRVSN
jgi:uncharacterized membrane protein